MDRGYSVLAMIMSFGELWFIWGYVLLYCSVLLDEIIDAGPAFVPCIE